MSHFEEGAKQWHAVEYFSSGVWLELLVVPSFNEATMHAMSYALSRHCDTRVVSVTRKVVRRFLAG